VKTEFASFGDAMEKVRKKLTEATGHIDKVGVRQRAITRKLRDVHSMPEVEAAVLIGVADEVDIEEPPAEAVA
jgi:DNA recombination protein RmuC